MADGASHGLSPKEAIEQGMRYLVEYMGDQLGTRVLLEGLKLQRGEWVVSYGFDSRKALDGFASLAGVGDIVREFRSIRLSQKDGSFVALTND